MGHAAAGASDDELVAQVADCSESALAELYRRHGGLAFTVAKRMSADNGLAARVVKEIFVELWDRPEAFDGARGCLGDRLVDLARLRSMALAGRAGRAHAPPGEGGVLADGELQIVEMALFQGRTCGEVAQVLRLPEGEVERRLGAALQRGGSALSG